MKSRRQTHFRNSPVLFPALVALVGLILTVCATFYAARSNRLREIGEFDSAAQHAHATITTRLESYIAILRGGAGLAAAQPDLTRAQFHEFVERLRLATNYPGIQGVGFSLRIPPGERSEVTRAMREQGISDFRIWPESERPEYHTIIYLEPLDVRNRAAIGYDMFTEPVRREAMERARDTGRHAATHKVTLVQEIDGPKQSGFLIYAPLYSGGSVPDTIAERRARLRGFVYSPFRMGDLMSSLLSTQMPPDLTLEIFDGATTNPDSLLFERRAGTDRDGGKRSYARMMPLDAGGAVWTLRFSGTFGAAYGSWLVPALFVAGTLMSLTLGYLTFAEARNHRAAEDAASRLRASEQALRTSEAHLRLMFENAQDFAIFSLNLEGRIVSWNPGAERLFGFGEAEAVGHDASIIFTPEDRSAGASQAELGQALERGLALDERWHQRKDGSRLFVSGVVRPMRDLSGSNVGFIKIARDITGRLQAEERLRAEKEFSDSIINSLPGIFYLISGSERFLRWNENLQSVSGYSAEEISQRHPLEFFDARDQSRMSEAIHQALTSGHAALEVELLTRDGRRVPYLLSGRRIVVNGNPCIMGMGIDISERHRAEQELRAAEERLRRYAGELEDRVAERTANLQESLESLEGVLYHVAHDLRAPLRAMASFTNILLTEYAPHFDERGRDYAARITASAGFMDQLVQDLLEYGRLGHAAIPVGNVSLEAEVNSVLREFATEIESKKASVRVEPPLPPVKGNAAVLHQVIAHLVQNALKFTPRETAPQVRIWAENGNAVRLWIEDNGIGIKPEYHNRIFRVFERLHPAEEYQGTGIGLAIVQKGLQRMNGTAGVESSPGQGSRFWVQLPRAS